MLDRNELEINDEFVGLFEKWVCDMYPDDHWRLDRINTDDHWRLDRINIQRMTLSCGLILRFILKLTTTSGMTQR